MKEQDASSSSSQGVVEGEEKGAGTEGHSKSQESNCQYAGTDAVTDSEVTKEDGSVTRAYQGHSESTVAEGQDGGYPTSEQAQEVYQQVQDAAPTSDGNDADDIAGAKDEVLVKVSSSVGGKVASFMKRAIVAWYNSGFALESLLLVAGVYFYWGHFDTD